MSAIPVPTAAPTFTRSRSLHSQGARVMNVAVMVFCYASALLAILALLLIFGYVTYKGLTSFNLDFFTKGSADGGMRNCISGSLILIAMASTVGIPLGMLCGIYLAEYAGKSWFAQGVRLVVDVLAGVPSVLIGVLGYQLLVMSYTHAGATHNGFLDAFVWLFNKFVDFRNDNFPTKPSAWAGALSLGVMMCPIIARTTEEMLKLVPKALREASIGLGASKAQTLFRVVIPAAATGIITGVMLSLARVAGETAPLLMTTRGSDLPTVTTGYDANNLGAGLLYLGMLAAVLLAGFAIYSVIRKQRPSMGAMVLAGVALLVGAAGVAFHTWVHPELNHEFPSMTVRIYLVYNLGNTKPMWLGLFVLITLVLVLNVCVRMASNRNKMKAI